MVTITRRRLIAAAGFTLAAPAVLRHGLARAASDPFTLGVASGDPTPDGFVAWTRLAPDPLAPDGGGGLRDPVEVDFEIATDEAMRRIVRRGRTRADVTFAHSVHLEVEGLEPNRPYWYRFSALDAQSPIGRARTAPARNARLDRLRFSFASCAHWELGYFSAYRHMAEEDPDLVLFLGDYIYEFSYAAAERRVRTHDRPQNTVDLIGYRNRYALHRTDPDLQKLHATAPCLMTWDDHEVENDYAAGFAQVAAVSPEDFLKRRAGAYQAFYEHMPLRRRSMPRGPDMTIFDRYRFGDLAEFTVLDGRQYRSEQACPTAGGSRRMRVVGEACANRTDPARTMLGAEQEAWLHDGFRKAGAKWNIIAQNVLVAPLLQRGPGGILGNGTDGWDGYSATRDRMLNAMAESRLANPVFLGGDMHSFWATEIRARPDTPNLAVEFVGSSVTADGPASAFADAQTLNPHIRYVEGAHRGYVSVDVTPGRMETRLRAISDRRDPKAGVSTLKHFAVEDGGLRLHDA